MRKFFYTLGIVAASAFAFSSCQKEQAINDEPQSGKLVTISFTAEKAGAETRTGVASESDTQVSYKWTSEDVANIKLFTVNGSTLTQVDNPAITVSNDGILTISTEVEANATYTFRAILAGAWTGGGKPKLSESQSPDGTSNFDPTADILISDDKVVTVGEDATTTGNMILTFHRKVVVNKMTLKNLTAKEKVDKVVITANDYLTGYIEGNTTSGQSKSITLDYNDVIVPSEGQFPVYFVTIPNSGQSLTVEVKTDQKVYSKSFAEGKTIDFNLGQFTKFNFALPEGVSNTALTLPIEDSMDWAISQTGGDESNALQTADLTAANSEGKKIYDSATKAYRGKDGLKLGTSGDRGNITTNDIDLSSAFYVTIDAKKFGSDNSQVTVSVDGDVVKSIDLTGEYKTYYINCSSATNASKITIGIAGKRGYIKNLLIRPGGIPEINVSNTTIEVDNSASSQEITYSIDNPSSGVSLTASSEATWIKNINITSNKVTFDVDAQEEGSAAREATVTLSYEGAISVDVTVQQAAGETSPYAAIHTSNITLSTEGGTSASYAKVNNYDAIKAGTGSVAGAVKIIVPANQKNLHIHAAGWKGESVTLSISGANTTPASLQLISDNGITNNSPFTLSGNADDFYFKITIPESTSATELTLTATNGKRFVIWGVNINDSREDAGIVWKKAGSETSTDTASLEDGDDILPTTTLNNPNNVTVTYSSSNTSVATIDGTGSITLVSAGETTISAIFAGDDDYKPATVEYTLTVTDNRTPSGDIPDPETIVFASLELENGVQYTDPFNGGNFTITFAGGGNDGKYYDTGAGIRTYGGGSISIASSHTISEIEFTWDGSNAPTGDNASPSGYSKDTKKWTGSSTQIVLTRPSGSGHWRLKSVTVTYSD